jgi:hypothetical protein
MNGISRNTQPIPLGEREQSFQFRPVRPIKIVVNHLARMRAGRVCVAGIDLSTGKHVRAILADGIEESFLQRNGGPFDIANVVDLGSALPSPKVPKFEDHFFHGRHAKLVRKANAIGFWDLLKAVSKRDLANIFGDKLVLTMTEKGFLHARTGDASLGCLIPLSRPMCYIDTWGKLRIAFSALVSGKATRLTLSLTDIRFFQGDHSTPNEETINLINARMNVEDVILGVGVDHVKLASAHYPQVHWIQVTAVHLSGDPTWQLG